MPLRRGIPSVSWLTPKVISAAVKVMLLGSEEPNPNFSMFSRVRGCWPATSFFGATANVSWHINRVSARVKIKACIVGFLSGIFSGATFWIAAIQGPRRRSLCIKWRRSGS